MRDQRHEGNHYQNFVLKISQQQNLKLTPIVGCDVPPLENTLGTGQILWQLKAGKLVSNKKYSQPSIEFQKNIPNLVLSFKDSVAGSRKISRTNSVALLQEVPGQKFRLWCKKMVENLSRQAWVAGFAGLLFGQRRNSK